MTTDHIYPSEHKANHIERAVKSSGRTWFVDSTVKESGDGSRERPFKDPIEAINMVKPVTREVTA